MKKNMLTIVAIALSLMNLILTAVIMLSVVSSAKATNALVSNIASIIDLELENDTSKNKVSISDMDVTLRDQETAKTIMLLLTRFLFTLLRQRMTIRLYQRA